MYGTLQILYDRRKACEFNGTGDTRTTVLYSTFCCWCFASLCTCIFLRRAGATYSIQVVYGPAMLRPQITSTTLHSGFKTVQDNGFAI